MPEPAPITRLGTTGSTRGTLRLRAAWPPEAIRFTALSPQTPCIRPPEVGAMPLQKSAFGRFSSGASKRAVWARCRPIGRIDQAPSTAISRGKRATCSICRPSGGRSQYRHTPRQRSEGVEGTGGRWLGPDGPLVFSSARRYWHLAEARGRGS